MTEIQHLPTTKIKPGDNDRQVFDPVALAELADSIRDNGLAQPITVRLVDDACEDAGYEIVAGERRFRAISTVLNWPTIPAIVRDLDDEQAAAIMLAENVHRVDLNPLDEAHAYDKRMVQFGWSIAETARQANVSETRVANRLKLLDLTPEIQQMVTHGHLPLGFAQAMAKLNSARQMQIVAWLREQTATPTARTFNAMVNELYEQQAQDTLFDLSLLLQPQVAAAVEGCESGKLQDMLPTLPGLPGLPTRLGGIGRLIDDYVAELIAQGQDGAARVMMDFWVKAMRANYAHVNALESKALAALLEG